MDKHFLEFWGKLFMNAARGQECFEEMTKWMGQGSHGFGEHTDLFRKCYGLDHLDTGASDYKTLWEKAAHDFEKSYKEWLSVFAFVPKEDYVTLTEKYETLKQKVSEQEETINHLRALLREKLFNPEEMAKGFEDLMQKQGDQFQQIVENMGQIFRKEPL